MRSGENSDKASGNGPSRPPTLKTIAFMTGYSVTAVSRALRDAPDISEETKSRVRQVAQQIGYHPSRAGLRLRTGRTQVISLILNTDEEIMGLTAQMVNGISERLRETNYHFVVTPYSHEDDPMDPVRYVVETGSADGVILSRIEPQDKRVRFLQQSGMPFATHGRSDMGIEHCWHDFDNYTCARDAVRLLSMSGVRTAALIAPPMTLSYAHHIRTGFADGVLETGLETIPIESITVDDKMCAMEREIIKVMSRPRRPDGIVCGSAGAAMAAVVGAEAAGLVVGRDVQIVSKQSTDFLHMFRPAIKVINENIRIAGFELADFVLRSIAGEPPERLQSLHYVRPPELQIKAPVVRAGS